MDFLSWNNSRHGAPMIHECKAMVRKLGFPLMAGDDPMPDPPQALFKNILKIYCKKYYNFLVRQSATSIKISVEVPRKSI